MSAHNGFHLVKMMIFIGLALICSGLSADTQVFEVWGPAGEGAGVGITTTDFGIAINFTKGETTEEMAEHIVNFINGAVGFSAWRVGNRIYVNHLSNITIEKVNVANVRVNSVSYNDGTAQIARNNLFQFTGLANGDGMISFQNADLTVFLPVLPGQTPMEIVDALTDAIQAVVPDDGLYSFGREFSSASFQDPPVPIGSVDLGIWALGNRNLLFTECISTDSGITVFQEAVIHEVIPTLTEWGLIFLVLTTLGIGLLRIFHI